MNASRFCSTRALRLHAMKRVMLSKHVIITKSPVSIACQVQGYTHDTQKSQMELTPDPKSPIA